MSLGPVRRPTVRIRIRYLTTFFAAAGVCASVAVAPIAAAAPECTNTGPTTTLCENAGNAQIVTSPPTNNYYPWFGWSILGGFGIGIGF
jgi:hypothetical protein